MPGDHPRVLTYPPIVFAVGIALGFVLHWLVPLDVRWSGPWRWATGGLLVAAGLGLIAWAILVMAAARTGIDPYRPATTLVTRGPFRFTRNPIYLAWLPAVAGLSLLAGTWWPLLMMLPTYAVVDRFIVQPEETYLSGKFGAAYEDYRARVRRWL